MTYFEAPCLNFMIITVTSPHRGTPPTEPPLIPPNRSDFILSSTSVFRCRLGWVVVLMFLLSNVLLLRWSARLVLVQFGQMPLLLGVGSASCKAGVSAAGIYLLIV